MAVRRLHPDQPANFAFTPENEAWVEATIKKYPAGKQASAVIPLLMRAQEQHAGWLPEPAIRKVADRLGMAYIRVYEIATFYTQFQLSPVGKKAHVQVCGTTPCMLRGAEALKNVCRSRIHHDPHHLSDDGNFSWEEVECAGACANAPMVQIFADTYEDLTPELLEKVLDGYAAGKVLKTGSQIGRKASAPAGGATTLKDASLYDGSVIGSWRQRFADAEAAAKAAAASAPAAAPGTATTPPVSAAPPAAAQAAPPAPQVPAPQVPAAQVPPPARGAGTPPNLAQPSAQPGSPAAISSLAAGVTAGAAATAAVGLMSGGGKVVSPPPPIGLPTNAGAGAAKAAAATAGPGVKPPALSAPRGGKGDDLKLLWGVADKLEAKLNAAGVWHFDQIAKWTPLECLWIETHIEGMHGRIDRDRWIEQAGKLAAGWRPDATHQHGERPKG
jgi:NADH-quinone oxidoreductase subunit E